MTTRYTDPEIGDHLLDALAWMRASLTGDEQARAVIATHCDPSGLVDALASIAVSHLCQVTDDPLTFIDQQAVGIREGLEQQR